MRNQVPAPPLRDITVGHFSLHKSYTCYREEGTNDWQLLFHDSGKGIFHHPDGDVEVNEGDCYLLPPRVAHDYGIPAEGGSWASYWVHFLPRANWLPYLQWTEIRSGLLYLKIDDKEVRDTITDLFKQCIKLVNDEQLYAMELAMTRLEEILIRIAQVNNTLEIAGLDHRIISAVKYIQENYGKGINLTLLATRARLSEASFCRLFKKEMGKSPINYLEHIRISHACHFLSSTTYSIKDITALLGFSAESYFCARFKKYNQMTPMEYRSKALPLDNSIDY